jgi:hypothetical protein
MHFTKKICFHSYYATFTFTNEKILPLGAQLQTRFGNRNFMQPMRRFSMGA